MPQEKTAMPFTIKSVEFVEVTNWHTNCLINN